MIKTKLGKILLPLVTVVGFHIKSSFLFTTLMIVSIDVRRTVNVTQRASRFNRDTNIN